VVTSLLVVTLRQEVGIPAVVGGCGYIKETYNENGNQERLNTML
jgi:hypothetical protein